MNPKQSLIKTLNSFKYSLPILLGVLLLVGVVNNLFQASYLKFFTGSYFFDPLVGGLLGSISFGVPLTSYVVGGELIKEGVSLIAVTAFIMTWSTVGVVMLPLEASYLGKKFALARNALNFVFAIIIAILTVSIVNFIQK